MKKSETKDGGFLQIIIVIIIALLIMKYFGVTISEVVIWFKTFFASVLK
ncbi:MAG: hypothetical protein UU10_C0011G0015 [Parcubacteria group bacterium GW2011_GWF1_40_6]|uniref:Uncharacterized protein n=1 Tax=Candidatus Nomurabacteria bacterium GW2011_GWF2_40_12 TaxID=1618776 RepID=A0A0G0QZQ3_9BACT|nr:MAG: hypothetical protein UT78_C0012G0007 [Candidatus Nomurabacteria bacterium GW2011_GWF2_40_12]KKR69568.1 MAG: hypothetical protein UU10_C0011G0015 [Parcubacteria group bacterium GW2011_GWF1_40_6]